MAGWLTHLRSSDPTDQLHGAGVAQQFFNGDCGIFEQEWHLLRMFQQGKCGVD